MQKIWYIEIKRLVEGPFSIEELQTDKRITLETLVWKEGFLEWQPLHSVPELKKIFEEQPPEKEEKVEKEEISEPADAELVLEMGPQSPIPPYVWLLLSLALLFFVLYQLYWDHA